MYRSRDIPILPLQPAELEYTEEKEIHFDAGCIRTVLEQSNDASVPETAPSMKADCYIPVTKEYRVPEFYGILKVASP